MDLAYLFKPHFDFKRGFALHYLLLYSIVYGLETKTAYEFGAGLSTRVILDALEQTDGQLTSCSLKSREAIGQGLASNPRWKHHHMKSSQAVRELGKQKFDFVLHDGSHKGEVVEQDLLAIVPHIKQFGILLVHDTQHSLVGEWMRDGMLKGLKGVEYSMVSLPYGCGLTIVRIEGNSKNGQIVVTRRKTNSENFTIPI